MTPGTPAYDDPARIAEFALTLEGLNDLRRLRAEAGYGRRERMKEWLVRGRWWLDTCGNFMRASVYESKAGDMEARVAALPLVTSQADVFREMPGVTVSSSMDVSLPPADVRCYRCGLSWFAHDAHDVVTRHRTEVVPLGDYVGRTIGDVRLEMARRTDAVHFMTPSLQWRNDRLIDLTPLPDFPECKANERGWWPPRGRGADRVDDSHVIEPGDEAAFEVRAFLHVVCQREDKAEKEKAYFTDKFRQAGFQGFRFEEIPNEYCPCEHCAPWYRVHTTLGVFRVGWRKNVCNIEWPDLGDGILPLFDAEHVTKSPKHIHAHSGEKVAEYLGKILGFKAVESVHGP